MYTYHFYRFKWEDGYFQLPMTLYDGSYFFLEINYFSVMLHDIKNRYNLRYWFAVIFSSSKYKCIVVQQKLMLSIIGYPTENLFTCLRRNVNSSLRTSVQRDFTSFWAGCRLKMTGFLYKTRASVELKSISSPRQQKTNRPATYKINYIIFKFQDIHPKGSSLNFLQFCEIL